MRGSHSEKVSQNRQGRFRSLQLSWMAVVLCRFDLQILPSAGFIIIGINHIMNWSLKDHKQHSYLPASDINLDPVPVTNKPRPHCLLFISRSRVVLPPWVSTTPCQMSVILDRQTSPAPCAVLDIFETHSCSQATRIARGMEKKRLAVLILEQPPPLSSTASQLPQEDY